MKTYGEALTLKENKNRYVIQITTCIVLYMSHMILVVTRATETYFPALYIPEVLKGAQSRLF